MSPQAVDKAKREATPDVPSNGGPPCVRPRRWSTAEYYLLAEAGILRDDERVELIDGEILLHMSPINSPHRVAVYKTVRRIEAAAGAGYYVDAQMPISLADGQEPQPDVFVARGMVENYADHHPSPRDLVLVVEVSDTSIAFDRTRKAALYGAAGIGEYWLIDLKARALEVRRSPAADGVYQTVHVLSEGDAHAPLFLPQTAIPVRDLLP